MTEQLMWHHIKRAFQELEEPVFIRRMENLVGPGTPDIYACIKGRCCWIECKEVSSPPLRLTSKVKFGSPFTIEQLDWHQRLYEFGGGLSLLVIRVVAPPRSNWILFRGQDLGRWLTDGPTMTKLLQTAWAVHHAFPARQVVNEALLFRS